MIIIKHPFQKVVKKMSRISRINNLRANRIRTNYVNRLDRGSHINRVEPLNPVEKQRNELEQPSENFLNSFEHYYSKFHELKKEFHKFYHHEKELLDAIQNLDEHHQKITKYTDDLVEKYNHALKSLADFDLVAGTQHVEYVRDVLRSFSKQLNEIGVTENEFGFLDFQPKIFAEFIAKDPKMVEETLSQLKTMIIQCYKSFTKIHVKNQRKNPYEQQPFQYKGLLIEEES